jgi:hypothetical protein
MIECAVIVLYDVEIDNKAGAFGLLASEEIDDSLCRGHSANSHFKIK